MRCNSCIHSYHHGSSQFCAAMDTEEEYSLSSDDMAIYADESYESCGWFKPIILADDTPVWDNPDSLDQDEFTGSYEEYEEYEEEWEYIFDPEDEEVCS